MADEQYPPPPSPGRPTAPPPTEQDVWPAHAWYHSWFVILLVLVMCGPVGLFLLWSSPYPRGWKIAVTIGTIAVYAVAFAIPSSNTLRRYG
jgi:hypothetical protein